MFFHHTYLFLVTYYMNTLGLRNIVTLITCSSCPVFLYKHGNCTANIKVTLVKVSSSICFKMFTKPECAKLCVYKNWFIEILNQTEAEYIYQVVFTQKDYPNIVKSHT